MVTALPYKAARCQINYYIYIWFSVCLTWLDDIGLCISRCMCCDTFERLPFVPFLSRHLDLTDSRINAAFKYWRVLNEVCQSSPIFAPCVGQWRGWEASGDTAKSDRISSLRTTLPQRKHSWFGWSGYKRKNKCLNKIQIQV